MNFSYAWRNVGRLLQRWRIAPVVRRARHDIPGTVQHVINRGLGCGTIVRDDAGRAVFVTRRGVSVVTRAHHRDRSTAAVSDILRRAED